MTWNPLGLTSLSEEYSRDIVLKLSAPWYPRLARDRIAVVLIQDSDLPLGGDEKFYWPVPFGDWKKLISAILAGNPEAVFIDVLFNNTHSNDETLGEFTKYLEGLDYRDKKKLIFADFLPDAQASDIHERGTNHIKGEPLLAQISDTGIGRSVSQWISVDGNYPLAVWPTKEALRNEFPNINFKEALPEKERTLSGMTCLAFRAGEKMDRHLTPAARLYAIHLHRHRSAREQEKYLKFALGCDTKTDKNGSTKDLLKRPPSMTVRWGIAPPPAFRPPDKCFEVSPWREDQERAALDILRAGLSELIGDTGSDHDSGKNSPKRVKWDQPQACPYHKFYGAKKTLSRFAHNGDKSDRMRSDFEGKVVLIGQHLSGLKDSVTSPVHGLLSGVFHHAMALDNLLTLDLNFMHPAPLVCPKWLGASPEDCSIIVIKNKNLNYDEIFAVIGYFFIILLFKVAESYKNKKDAGAVFHLLSTIICFICMAIILLIFLFIMTFYYNYAPLNWTMILGYLAVFNVFPVIIDSIFGRPTRNFLNQWLGLLGKRTIASASLAWFHRGRQG